MFRRRSSTSAPPRVLKPNIRSHSFSMFALTPRTILTLFAIHLVIALNLLLAHISLLPHFPHLCPLAIFLALMSSWSCYATIRRTSFGQYHALSTHDYQPVDTRPCTKCDRDKKPRTHHCSTCNTCTERMCHHCGILGVCVGANNYKAFVLLLFYGFVAALSQAVLCFDEAVQKGSKLITNWRRVPSNILLVLWLQLYYLQYCLVAFLGLMLFTHLYLIALNRTTLEACTLNNWRSVFPPWRVQKWPFDNGFIANYYEVFGYPLFALLPIANIPFPPSEHQEQIL